MSFDTIQQLFDNSDESLFKKDYSAMSLKYFSTNIIDKYPSHFFDSFLKFVKINNFFTTKLIEKIICSTNKYKYTELLCYLISSHYYHANNTKLLEKLLINNNLNYLYLYLKLFVKNKAKQIPTNIKIIDLLHHIGYNDEIITTQLLYHKLKNKCVVDMYENIVHDISSFTTQNEILNFCSKLTVELFQLLVNGKVITITSNIKKKLLSYTIQNKNFEMISYIADNNTVLPKVDTLCLLGISIKKNNKIKKLSRHRPIYFSRRRYLSKLYVDDSLYNDNSLHKTKLFELIKLFTNNNIILNKCFEIEKFILYLLKCKCFYLSIEICNNINYKIKSSHFRYFMRYIILSNDANLLKQIIKYKLFELEKFVNKSYFLDIAIKQNKFNIAKYMITNLKMKTEGKNVIKCSDNLQRLEFVYNNNLPIKQNILEVLFGINDAKSVIFCVEKLKLKITWKMIFCSFNKNNGKNMLNIILKYYNTIKHKNTCSTVIKLLQSKNTTYIFKLVKVLCKDYNFKSNIFDTVLLTKNIKLIKYFNKTHNMSLDGIYIEPIIDKLNIRKSRYFVPKNNLKKLLNIYKYIKTDFLEQFVNVINYITTRYDGIFNFMIMLLTTNNNEASTNILKFFSDMKEIFNANVSPTNVYNYISHSDNFRVIKHIVNQLDTIPDNIITLICTKYNVNIYHILWLKYEKNINIKLYVNHMLLIHNTLRYYNTINNFEKLITLCDIQITPFIYSHLVTLMQNLNRIYFYRRKMTQYKKLIQILKKYENNMFKNDHDILNTELNLCKYNFNIINKYNEKDRYKNLHDLFSTDLYSLSITKYYELCGVENNNNIDYNNAHNIYDVFVDNENDRILNNIDDEELSISDDESCSDLDIMEYKSTNVVKNS